MSNVVPGYVFLGASDPLTASKLNLLGTPTVTVGASEIVTSMIADNSVTVAKLAQATGGGFLGRTASTLGDISFVQLNDGGIAWPTYGLAISKTGQTTEFDLGGSSLLRFRMQYSSTSAPPLAISVSGTGTTDQQWGNGDVGWTAGTFTYNIGNGTTTSQQAFQITLVTGVPRVRVPSILCTGGAGSSGFGYDAAFGGSGGTVTQNTDKTTTVVLSKQTGQITMNAAALNAGVIVSFTLTNTFIAAADILAMNHVSGGTVGSYTLNAQCAAGSATINVRNNTAGNLSEAIVIGFVLIKGSTS